MAKVSVILPIYNVSSYLRQALDSVVNQTLKDIEIICIDDGSTDNSLDIVREYANKDSRFIVLTGPNGGYGKAMNKGIDAATGEYIGIVEPDDYIEPQMYEELYNAASDNDLDLVKSDFYRFTTDEKGCEKSSREELANGVDCYNKLLDPGEDPNLIRTVINNWTGIYRHDFIEQYHIRHNETPGAAFQDNGFFWQTFIYARRAMILNCAYYHNRRDNPNSSVKSREKVYCMNIEYDFIRDILMRDREIWERFKYMYWWKKYHNYTFTIDRIAEEYEKEFVTRMQMEFKRALQLGQLSPSVFTDLEWDKIQTLIKNSTGFYDALRSAKLVQKLLPYIPQSVKRMAMKFMGRRNIS